MRITQRSMKFYVTVEFQTSGFSFCECLVSVDSSHMTVSSFALWSSLSPPSNFVSRHVSTMCFMVCHWPQFTGRWLRKTTFVQICKTLALAYQETVEQRPVWRGRSKPGCQIGGSVTIEWWTTEVDDQSSLHCIVLSSGAMSDPIRCWAACVCSKASACTGQFGLHSIHQGALALWYCYKSTIWFIECTSFLVNLNQCEQFFALC